MTALKWISVEERLPPAHERVVLAFKDGNWGTGVYERKHLTDEYYTLFLFEDVTHWGIPETPARKGERR